VNECEPLIEQNHTQLLTRYTGKVTQIVRAFAAEWKRSIESINAKILQSFTNFKNGTKVLQIAFTQFVNYYQRFTKILSHSAFANNQQAKDELIADGHIIAELKKYKTVY
jgi:ribosome-binding ATPase YchF (GTP1/OBG family)